MSSQPSVEDARRQRAPSVHRDDAAIGEHYHHAGIHLGDGLEQRELIGGQIERVPVVAFRLGRRRQAEEQHGHVRAFCSSDGLCDEVLVGLLIDSVARCKHCRDATSLEGVEYVRDLQRGHLGRPGALITRGARKLSDEGEALPCSKRKQGGAVVHWLVAK